MRTRSLTLAVAAATAASTALMPLLSAPAQGAGAKPTTIAKGFLAPLSLAIASDGTAYASGNFDGTLWKVSPGKKQKKIYSDPQHREVGALSLVGSGGKAGVVFGITRSNPTCDTCGSTKSWVAELTAKGKVRKLANTGAWEVAHNPDHGVVYGFQDVPSDCASQWTDADTQAYGPLSHVNNLDTHVYATTEIGDSIYVADAAGNDVLKVSHGKLSTFAVLPPVDYTVSQDEIDGLNASGGPAVPECLAGLRYANEPVPTDIEVGPDHRLYVVTLGSEDGSTPASVYRYDPRTGKGTVWAYGLPMGGGIAFEPDGSAYVTTLFAGMIFRIGPKGGQAKPWGPGAKVQTPAAIEYANKHLYVTTNVLSGTDGKSKPNGKIVVF